jgi:hypothetical protein
MLATFLLGYMDLVYTKFSLTCQELFKTKMLATFLLVVLLVLVHMRQIRGVSMIHNAIVSAVNLNLNEAHTVHCFGG